MFLCMRRSFRFLKLWLPIALEWLHECCMGFVLGRKPEHETLHFSRKVAAAGDESTSCVCGGCGCGRSGCDWFLLCVLQRVVVPCCSCVRSSMRFLKLLLPIALGWLHECCMGFVLGRKPEHETLYFSV